MRRPLVSILVKPSGADCNIHCSYCFYFEKFGLYPHEKKHRMSEEILENLVRQVIEQSGRSVSIAWQGGEPTLMGLDFYKKALKLENKYAEGKRIDNAFQTNGILLDETWASFFQENNWLVGLSLDGPRHIHDRYRHSKGGGDTHNKVESVAKMLIENGVMINAMCCITDYSSRYPEELYHYYKELGMTYMQFIPVVETDKNDKSKATPYSVNATDYGNFLIKMFDLWIDDFRNGAPTTYIREFESLFYTYVGLIPPECNLMKTCGSYVVVEHNGDVYSCDFFVEPKWKLGNIKTGKIINMLNSKKQQAFGALKANFPLSCRRCPWLRHCYGGCIKDRVKNPRDKRHPHFCKSYQMFFSHADETFIALANQWKKNQATYAQTQSKEKNYNAYNDFVSKQYK